MTDAMITYGIVAAALAAILFRPLRLPEYAYACAGALTLTASGRIDFAGAGRAIAKGAEVYLFLAGMMILAEIARQEGLFDWTARYAVRLAQGSALRLFALVYATGVVVTAFLSNDATAVVLTPAVYAAARKAQAQPAPYLFACAFVANAASFILPISNPANLLMFRDAMPSLLVWLKIFAAPSALAIFATFFVLMALERRALGTPIVAVVEEQPLAKPARIAAAGLIFAAFVLTGVSWAGGALGASTLACSLSVLAITSFAAGANPVKFLTPISWGVLPLVGALFVMVDALARTGLVTQLHGLLAAYGAHDPKATAFGAGLITGVAANLVNNLPLGLLADEAGADAPALTKAALLIGVDLGPNLSVTGSLATILWLTALRREGVAISGLDFLKIGLCVAPPALILALAALLAVF